MQQPRNRVTVDVRMPGSTSRAIGSAEFGRRELAMVAASATRELMVVRHRTGGSCAGWAGWAWPLAHIAECPVAVVPSD